MNTNNQISEAVTQLATKMHAAVNETKSEVKELAEDFKTIQAQITELAQKQTGYTGGFQTKASPLGKFANDERVRNFVSDVGIKSASVTLENTINQIFKKSGPIVGDAVSSNVDYLNVQPQRDHRMGEMNITRQLTLLDVLPRIEVMSNAFDFNVLDGYNNAAAVQVAEGSGFAQTNVPTTLKTSKIHTYAHYTKLSSQVVADSPALIGQLDSLMRYGVAQKCTADIINGADGIEAVAATFAQPLGTKLADGIGNAMAALQADGWQPDTVLLHPLTWQKIRAERATTGEFVVGDWAAGAGMSIWGMDVVIDPAATQDQPVVFDRSQIALLDRKQARVELGRSGEDMTNGLSTLLAELRAGVAIFSPSAFAQVVIATS